MVGELNTGRTMNTVSAKDTIPKASPTPARMTPLFSALTGAVAIPEGATPGK